MIKRFFTVSNIPTLIIRLTVGLIFLSEGIQKFLFQDTLGALRFAKIGFSHPEFWASFTGSFEIVCGIMIVIGLLTRLASVPLLIVMLVAFITTKYPLWINYGFWSFAHEYRTDFAMSMLLIFLLIYGGGKNSLDHIMNNSPK